MPWQSQGGDDRGSGGPWGGGSGGGGGGSGGGGGGGGPWGRGSGGGGGGGGFGGGRPPDFEDFIRKGQDRFKRFMPSGGGGGKGLLLIAIVALGLWGFSGLYRVQPDQQGVVIRFGEWVSTTSPGLNWHWPVPIERVDTPSVERINSIDVGFRSVGGTARASSSRRDVEEESLMLTGDQNIIDIDFTVLWKIADAGMFLFNIRDPEATVKLAAESAMREIIGRTDIQPALTEARQEIEIKTRDSLQEILNTYEAGIEITQVQLQEVQPPAQVIDAFDDVQRSQQDRDRLRNEADAYRNDILPRARGEAQRMIQEAQAYKERLINEADGEAQRFLSVYNAYLENPEVTRRRMYLETLQKVFSGTDKVILDSGTGGAVPYLPLNELRSRAPAAAGQQ